MQEICAEAGISAGALYRYFASKAEIIAAIAEDKRGERDLLFLQEAQRSGLIEALCLIAGDFFEKLNAGDGALIADIIAESIRDDVIAQSLSSNDRAGVELIAKAIRDAQARREIDATLEPESAANTLYALIEGIGLRRAFLRETDPVAALLQFRAAAERYLSPRT